MGQRAAVYKVQVREKGKRKGAFRRLGNIDGEGTPLREVFEKILTDFQSATDDRLKVISATAVRTVGQGDLEIDLIHGQSGEVAEIYDGDGEFRIRQEADDTSRMRCHALFRLGLVDEVGWLAIHVNSGRGTKGLLEKGILPAFRNQFEDLMLEINPYVQGSVLAEAIRQNQIEEVELVKWEKAGDHELEETDKWAQSNVEARLSLRISVKGRYGRVKAGLLRRFVIEEDESAFDEIIEFKDIRFDEAKVEVALPGGEGTKVFNIEKPDAGAPITEELTGLPARNGEPTPDGVLAALRSILGRVATAD